MTAAARSSRHLIGRLAVLEGRVAAAVERRRDGDPEPHDAFRGLYLSDDHVDRLLTDPLMRSLSAPAPASELLLASVESAADDAAPSTLIRLRMVATEFGLSEIDVDVLIAAAAPDLDPRFEKLYGYLHDDVTRRRASIGLAIELAGSLPADPNSRARFDPHAPLVASGLLVIGDADRPFLTRTLRVPDRVTGYLLGDDTPDAGLREFIQQPPRQCSAEGDRIRRALDRGVDLVYCSQPDGLWAGSLMAGALHARDRDALVVDLTLAPAGSADTLASVAVREAGLSSRVLVLGPVDDLSTITLRTIARRTKPLVLYGHGSWDPGWSAGGVLVVDLHAAARRPAGDVWDAVMAPTSAVNLAELTSFRLAPDQIERAAAAAGSAATADDLPLTTAHVGAGARLQNQLGLGRLARRVEPVAGWTDLVLPQLAQSALHHLTDRVRLRETVENTWGLRRGGGRGEGITALFAGEPGTGKTMAAEVVAGALGFDLYVIDLSSVVDKYIGETEKNLERLFAGAEGVNGVLFFDEADALFGKRSEVNDARDRYANLETSYLLQRMESFDGLAILSTNLRSNLDPAFTRRLSMVIEFTRPDAAERRLLWAKALGAVPLADDVDLDFCANAFEIAGGDVRNIAITVAYLTAAAGRPLDMGLLMRAVQTEYRKLGRLCVESEFGVYYPLISQLGGDGLVQAAAR
jgi:hypothetical protein